MMKFQALYRRAAVFACTSFATFLFAVTPVSAELRPYQSESYRILGPNGTVIGWQSEQLNYSKTTLQRRRVREMRFTVDGHDPVSTKTEITYEMDSNGQPLSLNIKSEVNRKTQTYAITFSDGKASVRHTRGDKSANHTLSYPEGLHLHDTESLMLPASGKFLVFNASTMQFQTLVNKSTSTKAANIFANIRFADGLPAEIWLLENDKSGALIAATRPLLGSPIRFEKIVEGEDIPSLSGSGQINHQLVPASYTISGNAKSGKIRYNFGLLKPLVPLVPQTGEQAVTATDAGLRMDICEDCGPGLPTDDATLAKYTLPTRWLQSDAAVFMERGERMARRNISDANKMRMLGRMARGRLSKVDLNGHFSALDAWRNRAGDCTEDAVVLATLARASGIPAVVASGIVYTRERYHGASNAFVPHSWVVAYVDGKWQSFDYTLEEGFDSTHIALTIGEGDARSIAAATQIAAMLEWQSMAEVRRRPDPAS